MVDVLVSGATGYVGSAVVDRLRARGHRVQALVRSDAAAEALRRAGVPAVRGDLRDEDVVGALAAVADAVVHTAWDRDGGTDLDRAFARAVLTRLRPGAVYVHTSDSWMYGATDRGPVSDDVPAPTAPAVAGPHPAGDRAGTDAFVLSLAADRHVRACVVRPAPLIHGHGGNNLLPSMITDAHREGVVRQVGDGRNRWAAVHVDDLASLYALLLQQPASSGVVHAVAENVAMGEVMAAVARNAGARVEIIDPDVAVDVLGPWARTMTMAHELRAARAAAWGWSPTGADAASDIAEGSYATVEAGP